MSYIKKIIGYLCDKEKETVDSLHRRDFWTREKETKSGGRDGGMERWRDGGMESPPRRDTLKKRRRRRKRMQLGRSTLCQNHEAHHPAAVLVPFQYDDIIIIVLILILNLYRGWPRYISTTTNKNTFSVDGQSRNSWTKAEETGEKERETIIMIEVFLVQIQKWPQQCLHG